MAAKFIPFNELIGNFYPGSPLPKRPFEPYGGGKPVEFKPFDQLYDTYFNEVRKEIESLPKALFTDFKGGLWDSEDIKSAFKVNISKPKSKGAEDIPELYLDDYLDLKGANLTVNLNPYDWVTKPKSVIKGLVTDIVQGTTGVDPFTGSWNFTDVDTNIESDIWGPLVRGEHVGVAKGAPAGAVGNRLARKLEKHFTGKDVTPLSTGIGISDTMSTNLNDYSGTRQALVLGEGYTYQPENPVVDAQKGFVEGMVKLKNSGSRELTFTQMNTAFLDVLDKQSVRDHDVSYLLSAEASDLLNTRVSHGGKQTRVIDYMGNDALTSAAKNTESLYDTLKKQETAIADLNSKISALPAGPDRDDLVEVLKIYQKKYDFTEEKLYSAIHRLTGTTADPGIARLAMAQIDGFKLNAADADDNAYINVSNKIKTALKSNVDLYTILEKGELSKSISDARLVALKAACSANDPSAVYRVQFGMLSDVQSFDSRLSNVSKKIGKLAVARDKSNIGKTKADIAKNNLAFITSARDEAQKFATNELRKIEETRQLFKGNPQALEQFNKLFGEHEKNLKRIYGEGGFLDSDKGIKAFFTKNKNIYTTATAGGGMRDVTTRRFLETVYMTDSPLAQAFKASSSTDYFENSKRLYLISRNRYENKAAEDWLKRLEKGPTNVFADPIKKYVQERLGIPLKYSISGNIKSIIVTKVLEPTHYFGLVYNAENAEKYQKLRDAGRGKWVCLLEDKIGLPLTKLIGVNTFSINIDNLKFDMTGGEHLMGVAFLGTLFHNKVLDETSFFAFLNAKSVDDLDKILRGLTLDMTDKEALEERLAQLALFKKWLKDDAAGKKLAAFLGIKWDADGNIILNDKVSKFFANIAGRFANPALNDPTELYVGALKRLSQAMNVLQNKWVKMVMNLRRPFAYIKALIVEGVTNGIMAALDSVTGPLGELLRVFIKAVVQKLVDLGEKLIRGLLKFDLTEFNTAILKNVGTTVKYAVYFIAAPLIFLTMLTDPTTMFASGVSPIDNSRTDGVLLENACTGEAFSNITGALPVPNPKAAEYFNTYIMPKITEDVLNAYAAGESETGIPCEVLLGIHFTEGGNNPNQSLKDGSTLTGTLEQSAIEAANLLLTKLKGCNSAIQGSADLPKATYEDYICAISSYNGGGNSQCRQKSSDPQLVAGYTLCPELFTGEDDPYAVNWLIYEGRDHSNMGLIYERDGTKFKNYTPYTRPGSFTVSILAHWGL